LDDWVTCVSAKTTKGQSEIQSLSARISAAQQQINQLNNSQQSSAGQPGPTSQQASTSQPSANSQQGANTQQASTTAAGSTSSIDVWV
jgi:hypothetical protein